MLFWPTSCRIGIGPHCACHFHQNFWKIIIQILCYQFGDHKKSEKWASIIFVLNKFKEIERAKWEEGFNKTSITSSCFCSSAKRFHPTAATNASSSSVETCFPKWSYMSLWDWLSSRTSFAAAKVKRFCNLLLNSFFTLPACHQPVLVGFNCHFQTSVHCSKQCRQ